jgi:replicative DNA helicase
MKLLMRNSADKAISILRQIIVLGNELQNHLIEMSPNVEVSDKLQFTGVPLAQIQHQQAMSKHLKELLDVAMNVIESDNEQPLYATQRQP